uniref:Uncharacterized protein n=1 Tax=Amphiprion percula TaxID=161767 RepID=A0A3P8S298_AMPPE
MYMSAASNLRSNDQFLCSICLDVFTNPVSTSCGHNFCKDYITKQWDNTDSCQCPKCKEVFKTRPVLQVNTSICESVAQFRLEDQRNTSSKSVQIFTALQECVEKCLNQLIEELEEQQKTAEKQAEDAIKHLEKQISDSEEHLHFLQSFWTLKAALPTDDWMEICVRPPSYEGTVERAVSQLEEMLTENMKKTKLKQIKKFAVDVTLDPGTAHPNLILTDDGKQVKVGDVWKNLPDSPQRFFSAPCVLGKQSFSSGRFYFEVLVKGKTCWTLGVVRESINRKGGIKVSPRHGYWTIVLRNGNEYKAGDGPSVRLHPRSGPEKVGVFVDYEEGLVSFYDADTAVLIFSFTGCCFTEKLHPYFCPCLNDRGKNSAPLIICPFVKYASFSKYNVLI